MSAIKRLEGTPWLKRFGSWRWAVNGHATGTDWLEVPTIYFRHFLRPMSGNYRKSALIWYRWYSTSILGSWNSHCQWRRATLCEPWWWLIGQVGISSSPSWQVKGISSFQVQTRQFSSCHARGRSWNRNFGHGFWDSLLVLLRRKIETPPGISWSPDPQWWTRWRVGRSTWTAPWHHRIGAIGAIGLSQRGCKGKRDSEEGRLELELLLDASCSEFAH